MKINYHLDLIKTNYFIDKFKAIPENQWTSGNYHSPDGKRHCALGHCKAENRKEESVLYHLFFDYLGFGPASVNDMYPTGIRTGYSQKTPKKRILAALQDIHKQIIEKLNIGKEKYLHEKGQQVVI